MKVAVTGASGYIGAALCRRLESYGVFDTVKLSTHNQQNGISYFQTDYSVESLTEALSGASVVIHLAAVRLGTRLSDFLDNERITENLLIAMAKADVKRILYVSSISVYSDESSLPWSELQPPSPGTAYGITKLSGEYLCRIYGFKHSIRSTVFRLAHVYGPFDENKRITAVFTKQAMNGEALHVYGKSLAKREFIYLQDVIDALIWGINNDTEPYGVYNLGTGIGLTNYEVASIVNRAFSNRAPIIYHEDIDEKISSSYMDETKLKGKGFYAQYDMEKAFCEIARIMNR
ncbi:MAG: SDR family oxidoreductase [Oscillospiraceae bacterium]|nr:SDR family oxidoreductase [Oscillospiraceae bacterium]